MKNNHFFLWGEGVNKVYGSKDRKGDRFPCLPRLPAGAGSCHLETNVFELETNVFEGPTMWQHRVTAVCNASLFSL